jgi:hypothetical protein
MFRYIQFTALHVHSLHDYAENISPEKNYLPGEITKMERI